MKLRVFAAAIASALTMATTALAAAPSSLQHDQSTIRFFNNHPGLAHTKAGERALWRILDHVVRHLQAVAVQPAHLSLWRCIERGESGGDGIHPGNTDASNGSHFNVLQMTSPWGSDNFYPIGKSYQEVEAEAEKEYAASGYSRTWLEGQWGQTIGPCWGYA